MVSGSYEHAYINKTCSVHPPSWVSCSLHVVHFRRHKAGKEFEEKGGEGLSIKYHKLPSNPIQNEQSLISKEITNLNKLQ